MKNVGVIGLGDMGIALAKNIIKAGFNCSGFDLRQERLQLLQEMGGTPLGSPQEVGAQADAVFIMVLNGQQVYDVVTGDDGLLQSMQPGSTIIISATIEPKDVRLVVETGNNAMITSAWLGRKLIDELGSARLKLLWDPCNGLYCNEPAYPDGYEAIRGDRLGHIHIKDSFINIPPAMVVCTALNTGHMAPYLAEIAAALKNDGYEGVISLESV